MSDSLLIERAGPGVFTITRTQGDGTHKVLHAGGFDVLAMTANYLAGTPCAAPAPGKAKAPDAEE